jgi:hypothetical protein
MIMEDINQYDSIELKEDLNPVLKIGMQGVVLEKYTATDFIIEVLDEAGVNLEYDGSFIFTVNIKQIKKVNPGIHV